MKPQHTGYAWHIAKTKFVTINSIVMLGEKSLSWSSTTHWSHFSTTIRSYSGCWIHRLLKSIEHMHRTRSLPEASLEIAKGSCHSSAVMKKISRNLLTLKTIHKCIHKRGSTYHHEKFIKQSDMGNSRTRGASKLYLHRPRTDFYKNSFEYSGRKLWNSLLASVRDVTARLGFSNALQRYFNSS